ncbi:TerB family tellurite resistance protein [Frigidibacter sp. RF13]|uniref:tellurite resistance TerB family protein n=1 Tax=Frigidibacter sp. RF13 TaxID=2997340 RepID=UPI0022700A49|nr:TerB family tellurite resistance protein [Frigidibacter sp. RF13]MCY1127762.1 TerB family tellurite resistance protein [Frigidibacter sp. RF13]
MVSRFLKSLLAPAPTPVSGDDAALALAALLVRVARADGSYESAERDRIDRILTTHHALGPFEAVDLRQRAEALEAEAPDTVRFTRALKEAVPHEERLRLIEALWSVAFADDRRDAEEDALIRLVANLLGITDRDSALARQKVTAR